MAKKTSFIDDQYRPDYLADPQADGPSYVSDGTLAPDASQPRQYITAVTPAPGNMPAPAYTDPDLDPNAYSAVNPPAPAKPAYTDPDLDPNAYSPVNPTADGSVPPASWDNVGTPNKPKTAAQYRQEAADLAGQRPEDKSPGIWRTLAGIGAGIGVGYLTRNPNMVASVQGQIMHPGAAKVQKWAADINDKELAAAQAEKIDADARAATAGDVDVAHVQSQTRHEDADTRRLNTPAAPTPLTKNDVQEVPGPDGRIHLRVYPDANDPNKFTELGLKDPGEPKGDPDMQLGIAAWKRQPENAGKEPTIADLGSIRTAIAVAKPDTAKTDLDWSAIATDPNSPPAERKHAEDTLKRTDTFRQGSRPITNNNFQLPGLPTVPETPEQKAATGDEYLGTLTPSLSAQVKAIAEGRAALPPASARSQAAVNLRNAVFHYDPSYSDQRAQIRKGFMTIGKTADNIRALNTAPIHLDQLQEAATAMDSGSFRPGNAAWNAVKTTFGAAAPANFDGLKAAVSSEMASALKGNATDQEIQNIQSTIDRSSSPAQLAGIVKTNLGIVAGKLNIIHQSYLQQIPNDNVWSPVLPAAKAVFEKYNVNPTTGANLGDSGGGTAYKFVGVGPNGHKIGSNGGPWVDIQTGKAVQ